MAGDEKAMCRLVIGTVFLNILPAIYYEAVVGMVQKCSLLGAGDVLPGGHMEGWLLMVFFGTAGAGFYRIFAGVLSCRLKSGRFVFYADRVDWAEMWADFDACSCRQRNVNRWGFYKYPGAGVRRSGIGPWDHISGGFLYLVVPIGFFCAAARAHCVPW